MVILKYIVLFFIFIGSSYTGILMSRKYRNRVYELREFKEAINILENKIRFTYKPLGEIFDDIIKLFENNICILKIFEIANQNMINEDVSNSWEYALESSKSFLSLNDEDINIIKGLGKLLRENGC